MQLPIKSRWNNAIKRFTLPRFLVGIIIALLIFGSAPLKNANALSAMINNIHENALANETNCIPLDLVFVIDQSDNTLITAEHLLDIKATLADLTNIILNYCKNVTHRVAIVSYGTLAEVNVPLSLINPMDDIQAQIIPQTLAFHLKKTKMGDANPLVGLRVASEILDNAPPYDSDKRKRVIIFVTGSVPCVNCSGASNMADYLRQFKLEISQMLPFGASLLARENCIISQGKVGEIQTVKDDLITQCYNNFQVGSLEYQTSTYIDSISFIQGQTDSVVLNDVFSEISIAHAGRFIDLNLSKENLSKTLRNIIEQLSGVTIPPLGCNNFIVNPYLQRIHFTFYKISPETRVSLSFTDENGNRHTLMNGLSTNSDGFGSNVADYYSLGANESYTIDNPVPGIWQVSSDTCTGFEVFMEPPQQLELSKLSLSQANKTFQYNSNDLEPYFDKNSPIYIHFQLIISTYEYLKINPSFPIEVQAIVTNPNGQVVTHRMLWDGSSKSFVSDKPLETPIVGTYAVQIIGTTMIHTGDPVIGSEKNEDVFNTKFELFSNNFQFNVIEETSNGSSNNANKINVGYLGLTILTIFILATTFILAVVKKGFYMRRREVMIVVSIGIISGIIGILGNVLADSISTSLAPYLWIAWPIFILCTIAGIALSILQLRKTNNKNEISSNAKISKKRTSKQSIQQKANEEIFDVFLAHNNNDKALIELIAKELRYRDIKPWLDNEQIRPGRWFQGEIQDAIRQVKSAAIFIGTNGLGKWQEVELRTLISICVEKDIPVIPVLLPGVSNLPPELLFLREMNWVKFSDSIYDKNAIDKLEWGITGKKPEQDNAR